MTAARDIGPDTVFQLNAAFDFSKTNLTPEEAFILSRVDGKVTVAGIASILSIDEMRVSEHLSKFQFSGMIVEQRPIERKVSRISEEDESEFQSLLAMARKIKRRQNQVTYYALLEVSPDASEADIHKRYYDWVKSLHPDSLRRHELGKYKGMFEDAFTLISRAFHILSNAKRRQAYDDELAMGRGPGQGTEAKAAKVSSRGSMFSTADRQFEMGEAEESKGNLKAALGFYRMAEQLEPENPKFQRERQRVEKSLGGTRRTRR